MWTADATLRLLPRYWSAGMDICDLWNFDWGDADILMCPGGERTGDTTDTWRPSTTQLSCAEGAGPQGL